MQRFFLKKIMPVKSCDPSFLDRVALSKTERSQDGAAKQF